MSTKLVRHRKSAYLAQSGLCYYCKRPMWQSDVESFSKTHNIKLSHAQWLKCTAEHLEARKDGGIENAQNIVAACRFCNQTRHRRKNALPPEDYKQLVQRRLSKGRWRHIANPNNQPFPALLSNLPNNSTGTVASSLFRTNQK